ncbi:TDT family transporter [Acinetobacter bereziniae]|uniref:TDT family transporter n=1 Tax=Acinetobacter bereziniae TaxID=106648 RepID=UPI00125063BB|nr:TDT family transporter [Acinetobacter bereziniae]MBJ8551472.1 TDT family transporter [Acinetobacter bereziniae]MCU4415673.1 TDT family transporter [Acinetobacter bereziniae]MCU4538552.1 TDT family transporter [Acinetobacter bereziniae]
MKKPFYQLEQTRDVIRQFTPNWFTMTMGTGVVALILPEFPFAQDFLWQLATLLWQFNILVFITFMTLYVLRWLIYPQEAKQIFSHPAMALFLGAIPMGLATILNGFLKYGIAIYGDAAIQIAQLLWFVDVILAVGIGILVPFCMFHKQEHQLHTMTAMWLLPIVACEVAATSGGLLLAHMEASQQAIGILFASYMLWGMSVLPAFGILTILMLRLALHKLPSKELAITGWLALGPIGTGALALLVLGAQAPQVLTLIHLESLGVFFQNAGIVASFMLLGFGVWWFAIAVLTTLKHAATELPFNLGWWGLTFPLGVFTLAILNVGHQLQVNFIVDTGLAFAAILMMLWLMVMVKTVQGIYQGNLFFSPCLKAWLEREQA